MEKENYSELLNPEIFKLKTKVSPSPVPTSPSPSGTLIPGETSSSVALSTIELKTKGKSYYYKNCPTTQANSLKRKKRRISKASRKLNHIN